MTRREQDAIARVLLDVAVCEELKAANVQMKVRELAR